MAFHIYSAKDLPLEAWSLLTGNSFFASPAFASLWETFGGHEVFLADEEQGILKAGMAGIVFGRKYLRRFRSMPEGFYGGIYWSDTVSEMEKGQFIASFEKYLKKEKFIRADIHNPPSPFHAAAFAERTASTHILHLENNSYEYSNPNMTRYIRHARKEGDFRIAVLDDENYLDGFYRLVLATCRRHNVRPRYSREFFSRLLAVSKKDSRVIWPIVLSGDTITASHIRFVERSQIFAWQNYSDRDDPLRPNYLLYDYIINLAISRNIKEINLGGSPPGADGLVAFKERWGGRKSTYSYYTYLSGLGKFIYRGRRA
jgi:Acetyltransferase (GNAT) domain